MRHEKNGKLVEWNDERGFGWVEAEGQRVFAHISEFGEGQPRPRKGDRVTYRLGKDGKGRRQAKGILMKRTSSLRGSLSRLAFLVLLVLPILAGGKLLPQWWLVPTGMVVMSVITWSAYRDDKRRSQAAEWRVRESTLHLLELLGGWPGAFFAQRRFRHKVSKGKFLFVFWLIVTLWQLVSFEIVSGGVLRDDVLGWLSQRYQSQR
ncbi:MAG: DUF1294 domain-containing protein [Verrucomicrobiota bacterium JB023]|nr:DUF1294 domain-containing protein [Verrucomicrobiota bacterium JB023]